MMTIDETEADLKDLIERAIRGEDVVITRAGEPIAQVTSAAPQASPRGMTAKEVEALRAHRVVPHAPIDAARLVREMRDEGY